MIEQKNKELEKNMIKIQNGLKETQRELEEKQEKRFWKERSIPFTLHEGLNTYTKDELDEIRKSLQIKNASSLKKAELIALLHEKIPPLIVLICMEWDDDRFTLLTKIANHGGYIAAPHLKPEQIRYLRASGLIFTGTFNGKKVLAVPEDLIEPVKSLQGHTNLKSTVHRNTEWIKLTKGLLYYYGTLSSAQLKEMVETYTKETLFLPEYLNVIHNANSYQKEIHIDDDGFSDIRVFDPKRVKQEHQMRESLSFYSFTKNQLLKAGEPGFVERNKSYTQLVHFLMQEYKIDQNEADYIVEECVYATRIGDSPNSILEYLRSIFEFESLEDNQALMDLVIHLMNNTREWFLKGHTSAELGSQEKQTLRPLPKNNFNPSKRMTKEKIGRNDPCPCGSGKKYKKCCGR